MCSKNERGSVGEKVHDTVCLVENNCNPQSPYNHQLY